MKGDQKRIFSAIDVAVDANVVWAVRQFSPIDGYPYGTSESGIINPIVSMLAVRQAVGRKIDRIESE